MSRFQPPSVDGLALTERLGWKGYLDDVSLAQYVAWGDRAGVFESIAGQGPVSSRDLAIQLGMTERPCDALTNLYVSLGLLVRSGDGRGLSLSELAREYLLRESPYYAGRHLFLACNKPVPRWLLRPNGRFAWLLSPRSWASNVSAIVYMRALKLHMRFAGYNFGGRGQLSNQHSRNLAANVRAAKTGEFADVKCLVDIGGGTGSFAIPLALENPRTRIIITDLPNAVQGARRFLETEGLGERIELMGLDAFETPWPIPSSDGIFLGNFIHGWNDQRADLVFRAALERLEQGGKVWVHEMVWNEHKDGPIKTALWDLTMARNGGRQRTVSEIKRLLTNAGFVSPYNIPTQDGFELVAAAKP